MSILHTRFLAPKANFFFFLSISLPLSLPLWKAHHHGISVSLCRLTFTTKPEKRRLDTRKKLLLLPGLFNNCWSQAVCCLIEIISHTHTLGRDFEAVAFGRFLNTQSMADFVYLLRLFPCIWPLTCFKLDFVFPFASSFFFFFCFEIKTFTVFCLEIWRGFFVLMIFNLGFIVQKN